MTDTEQTHEQTSNNKEMIKIEVHSSNSDEYRIGNDVFRTRDQLLKAVIRKIFPQQTENSPVRITDEQILFLLLYRKQEIEEVMRVIHMVDAFPLKTNSYKKFDLGEF